MDSGQPRVRRCAVLSGLIVAAMVCCTAAAAVETAESEGRMIAPRRLHPRLQQFGKIPRQSQSAMPEEKAAPFSEGQLQRSPATDPLVISKGFAGIAYPNSFGSVPPDPHVATGPAHIVEVTNSTVAFYNRFTGKRIFLQDLTVFFASVGAGAFVFDPQVSYDELAERFVIAVLDVIETPAIKEGYLLYAVSNSADPSDGFAEMHRIDVTETGLEHGGIVLPDFPRMGWNADAHVITLNMFGEEFDHVSVITINKSTVLDANPATFSATHKDRNNDHFTMVPAIMHESVSGDPMWLVEESSDAFGSKIRLVKMTNLLGSSPNFTQFDEEVTPYDIPPNADQRGSGIWGRIHTNDASILSVAWRGNRLLAAHNIGLALTTQSHVRWYEFETSGTPSLTQEGTINPGFGIHTYYPSIEIAPNGDIGMTFMQSSFDEFMSMYVTGRTTLDPTGEMRPPVLAKAGLNTYRAFDCAVGSTFDRDCRGGDYSGISVDPNFSNMFCAANEYATSSRGRSGSNNWGTWIACFSIGVHDLAVTSIVPPASVTGPGPVTGAVKVTIQNRGDHAETILPVSLGDGHFSGLVRLNVSVLDDNEGCLAPVIGLDTAKNDALFRSGSIALSPKKSLTVNFLVTFNCPGALPRTSVDSTPGDYRFSATVHHEVLDGSADIHEEDDVCPRGPLPGLFDVLPAPSGIADKGCGAANPDRTLGAPVTTQVVR